MKTWEQLEDEDNPHLLALDAARAMGGEVKQPPPGFPARSTVRLAAFAECLKEPISAEYANELLDTNEKLWGEIERARTVVDAAAKVVQLWEREGVAKQRFGEEDPTFDLVEAVRAYDGRAREVLVLRRTDAGSRALRVDAIVQMLEAGR